ncbi:MAG: Vps62-related protein [Deltaproteobacteria bacterium]|nr:Vps62-related protein [Deltaproteobacteria bacterium]
MSRRWVLAALALSACSSSDADSTSGGTSSTGGAATGSTEAVPTSDSDAPPDSTLGGSQTGGTDASATAGLDTSTGTSAGQTDGETEATDTGEIRPDPQQVILETYAPRIWFPVDEEFWPSSVEWAYPGLERFPDAEGQHWVRTIDPLQSPSDTLPLFDGDLGTAPIYGYWADKGDGIVDLVYFVYYPYNRGKSVVNTIWGNHVGDWEHITVRLLEQPDGQLAPTQVYLSAHNFGGAYPWGNGEVALHDGTHPVVYSAWGSHGFWAQPGDHVYASVGETDPIFDVCITLVCVELVDETAAGVAWDTWEVVHGMDFFEQQGLQGADWPVWMSDAFTDPGAGDPTVPGMGPIYRWGNEEDCSVLGIPIDITDLIGVCRLEDGPTGPVSKSTWGPQLR